MKSLVRNLVGADKMDTQTGSDHALLGKWPR